MIPQTPRHDFLHELHKLLRPGTYLEIGVQTGRSLAQAIPPTFAVGVDPDPQISVPIGIDHRIHSVTSDEFFAGPGAPRSPVLHPWPVDLAFIDGMHLVENCLRDFIGVERLARPDGRTVAVFDDVLPYSADIAGRTPLPGDWAGDCWKIYPILRNHRPDLDLILVDVVPTGALVVLSLNPGNIDLHGPRYNNIVGHWMGDSSRVAEAIDSMRTEAVSTSRALDMIREYLNITEA